MPVPIDRTKPPYRDDPVIAALTDEEVWALTGLMARLARAWAERRERERSTADPSEDVA